MRWKGRRTSTNVEDRRGSTARRVGGGLGIGTIILVVITLLMGGDLGDALRIFSNSGGGGSAVSAPTQSTQGPTTTGNEQEDELAEFVSVVLATTEDVWVDLFPKHFGKPYQKPNLVLFSGKTNSGCGFASSATGPFYCPGDQKLYIDLSFYRELVNRFKAPGDMAMAYIVGHEVAHHVQYMLGYTAKVDRLRRTASKKVYNDASVRLELMADFLAGVWAHHAQKKMPDLLQEGDIEEALRAAHAVGDDRIQMEAQGYVVPDSFTHGTSEQRMRWFSKGFKTGDVSQGDTFAANPL